MSSGLCPHECPHESAVVQAFRTGEWTDGERSHASHCAECARSLRVARWMDAVATELGHGRAAPDPTFIWLKARIERGTSRPLRVGLALRSVLDVALGVGVAAAVLTVWPWTVSAMEAARVGLVTAVAEMPVLDLTVIGAAWAGLPLLLLLTYLLVFRPLR